MSFLYFSPIRSMLALSLKLNTKTNYSKQDNSRQFGIGLCKKCYYINWLRLNLLWFATNPQDDFFILKSNWFSHRVFRFAVRCLDSFFILFPPVKPMFGVVCKRLNSPWIPEMALVKPNIVPINVSKFRCRYFWAIIFRFAWLDPIENFNYFSLPTTRKLIKFYDCEPKTTMILFYFLRRCFSSWICGSQNCLLVFQWFWRRTRSISNLLDGFGSNREHHNLNKFNKSKLHQQK